jgi:adenylosuccinate lyase
MIAVVIKGMPRVVAHILLQQLVFHSQEKNKRFSEVLEGDTRITKYLGKDDIHSALNPNSYLGLSSELVDAAVEKTVTERKARGLAT